MYPPVQWVVFILVKWCIHYSINLNDSCISFNKTYLCGFIVLLLYYNFVSFLIDEFLEVNKQNICLFIEWEESIFTPVCELECIIDHQCGIIQTVNYMNGRRTQWCISVIYNFNSHLGIYVSHWCSVKRINWNMLRWLMGILVNWW